MASAPFKWCVRDNAVAKVLLPLRCWERRVVLFFMVWRMLTEEIRSGCGEGLFFLLSSLSHSWENTPELLKNNCVIWFVILSISVLLLLITVYFAFYTFWSLDFFLISSLNILFDLRIQLLKSLQATTYYLNPYYNYNFNFKVRLYQCLKRMVSDIGERCKIDLKLELFRDAKGMYEKKITYDCIVYFYPSSLHCTFSYYVKNIFFTTLFF